MWAENHYNIIIAIIIIGDKQNKINICICDLVVEWFRKLYEWTKLPLVPLYGGFPVKLRYLL